MVGVFLVGLRAPTRDLAIGAVAAVGLLTATSLLEGAPGDLVSGIAWVAIVPVGIPALAGRVLRSRNALNRRLDEQAREIESNRAEREAAAVLGERTGSRASCTTSSPTTSRSCSSRPRPPSAPCRPTPSAPAPPSPRSRTPAARRSGSCGACSASCGAATRSSRWLRSPRWSASARSCSACAPTGLPVELEVAGDPVHLPPGVDAAAFRIVQEALVNVVRHAAATQALVRVDYEPDAVELVVSDDGRGGGPIATAAGSSTCASASRSTAASCAPARRAPRGFELRARLPVGEPAT